MAGQYRAARGQRPVAASIEGANSQAKSERLTTKLRTQKEALEANGSGADLAG